MKSNYIMKTTTNTSASQTATATSSTISAPRRGVKKGEAVSIVQNYTFPATPFTLKEIAYSVGIDHWFLFEYVKKNSTVVGDAPKAKGSRGPAAKLYQLTK